MQLGVMFGAQLLGGGFGMKALTLGASVAGSLLLNGKKEAVGKLNDLRVSGSSYGRGIGHVWGTMRCTGNLIWTTNFVEEKFWLTSKGKRKNGKMGEKKGKKGKATETYEYFANFGMGLCAGPVDNVLRIWADNNLIYDKLNPDNEDLVDVGFTTRQDDNGGGKRAMKSPQRKKGSQGDSGRFAFRFHAGSESQEVDPFILKTQGTDNSVPFRGLCYLFFEKFALADFGNRIPTITAEVSVTTERKPYIRTFKNMEPPLDWSTKTRSPTMIDPIRQRFYTEATTKDGKTFIRAYDMNSYKEIKRIQIAPAEDLDVFPQEVQIGRTLPGDVNTTFWDGTHRTVTHFGEWIGISAKGELIFVLPFGTNYNPIAWVDPDSLTINFAYGGASTMGSGEPFSYLGRGWLAYPMLMNSALGSYEYCTAIQTAFSDIAYFDTEYRLAQFTTMGGMNGIGHVNPGVPGTDNAVVVVHKNIYSLEGRIYTSSLDEVSVFIENEDGTESTATGVNMQSQKLFYTFPRPEDDPDDEVWISAIVWAGYCAGSQTIAAIGWIQSGSPDFPNGIYGISIDPMTREQLWCERLVGVNRPPDTDLDIPFYLSGNQIAWVDSNRNYITVDFRQEKYDVVAMPHGLMPDKTSGEYYYSDLDAILYFSNEVDGGSWIMGTIDRKVQVPVSVSDICRDVAVRVGIAPERIDLSGMTLDEEVTGYMLENPTPARQVLEELSNVFMFDVVESDNILKFKTRGSASVVTIPQDDLGIVETDFGTDNEYYTETRIQEIELPERVQVSFIDPKEDYETGAMHYKRPLRPLSVMGSRELLELTLNMAMTPKRAKTLAKRILFAAWGERTSHEYTLPRDYLMYEPSDVITVELENGERFLDRLTDVEIGDDMSMRVSAVSQIADAYTQETTVGDSGGMIILPRLPAPTVRAGIYNVPYLRDDDVDDNRGFLYYWSVLAYADGFRFGSMSSQIANEDQENEGVTSYDAIWGQTVGAIPNAPGPVELTDFTSRITLAPAFNFNETTVQYTWTSIPDDEWPNYSNMIIIGDEVILFKNVTENGNGTVTIDTLIRGAKGTGNAAYQHVRAEEWTLVMPSSMMTADASFQHLLVEHSFTVSSLSPIPPLATKVKKTLTGATKKPWQVGRLRRTNNKTAGTATVLWERSTRFGGEMANGSGTVPLNESKEEYEIFLLKDPFDINTWYPEDPDLIHLNVKDILTPSYTFSAAELAAAGLTYESDLHVVIYQNSTGIGRGYPRGVTLPYATINITS